MIKLEKRDREHIKEMRGFYHAVVSDYRHAVWAMSDDDDLTPYQRRKVREFLKEHSDYDRDDALSMYMQDDLLEYTYTGIPMYGGNTYYLNGWTNWPRAEDGEYYVWMLFAYGGPSYGIRARKDIHLSGYSDITFVFHDWFVGYEMPVPDADFEMWETVIGYYDDCVYDLDEIYEKMRDNGQDICPGCGTWQEMSGDDGDVFCKDCASTHCAECHDEDDEDDLTMVDGRLLCELCQRVLDTFACACCGVTINDAERISVADVDGSDDFVCEDCAVNAYDMFQCEGCNDWYDVEDSHKHLRERPRTGPDNPLTDPVLYCDKCYNELFW